MYTIVFVDFLMKFFVKNVCELLTKRSKSYVKTKY